MRNSSFLSYWFFSSSTTVFVPSHKRQHFHLIASTGDHWCRQSPCNSAAHRWRHEFETTAVIQTNICHFCENLPLASTSVRSFTIVTEDDGVPGSKFERDPENYTVEQLRRRRRRQMIFAAGHVQWIVTIIMVTHLFCFHVQEKKKKLLKLNSHFEYECVVVVHVKKNYRVEGSIGMCSIQ